MKKIANLGFTLIELLVSMTVVAILALGVYYFLDPVEIVRKAKDTTSINNAKEFAKSIAMFHTNNIAMQYPWNLDNQEYRTMIRNEESAFAYDPKISDYDFSWAYSMVETGDLSETIYKRLKDNDNLVILKDHGIDSPVWVCFEPESKQRKKEAAQSCMDKNRIFPKRVREVIPCDTVDGLVPSSDSGMKNLFCLTS